MDLRSNTAAALLLVILLFSALVRVRLLDLPLERDEGEYAYAGQLILDGIPPYRLVYNMKWPGTYGAYAAIMGLFGETIPGIRLGLFLVTAGTTLLLYFLTAGLFGRLAGVVAAAAHALLAANLGAMGTYGHAMHFVALPAVGAALLLTRLSPARLYAAGVLLALAVLMKQPGIVFVAFAALWVAFASRKEGPADGAPADGAPADGAPADGAPADGAPASAGPPLRRIVKNEAILAAGGITVAAITAAILLASGVFGRFWFWTIDYAREYVTQATGEEIVSALDTSLGSINYCAPLIWLAALAGLVLLFADRQARRHAVFTVGFLLASLLATVPGFYFRPHYFLVAFPAVAMLAGIAAGSGARLLSGRGKALAAIPVAAVALILLMSVVRQWTWWMSTDLHQLTRVIYRKGPFNESLVVADYLRRQTEPGERIAVVGSEPQIYFYSGRKSATGYIYTYALLELQKFALSMQEEMIREIEEAEPKYLVYVNEISSWARRDSSQLKIFEWLQRRANEDYQVDGYADLLPSGTVYVWGEEARTYVPKAKEHILLLRRVPPSSGP